MKIVIGSDHAGYALKQKIIPYLVGKGYEPIDVGAYSTKSVDYPEIAAKIAKAIIKNGIQYGIGICGTGLGMDMALNKYKGIRAALCLYPYMAEMSKLDNDANVLVLAGRLMGVELSFQIVTTFLNTEFSGVERHARRVKKIGELSI